MSEFSNVITSRGGFRLIELSTVMGKPLIFTKIEIGKGINTGGGRDSLIDKTMECDVTRVAEVANADVDESRLALYFAYSNDAVEEGYSMTEVGLWAKVVSESYTDKDWDGYQGEEVFFGYSYADSPEKGSWIPDKNHKMDVQELAKITPRIASATLSVSRVAQIHGVVTNYSSTNQYKDVPRDGWSGTVISGEETGGGTKDHGMEVRNVLETLSPSISVAPIGGNESHENRPPFQGVAYWVRTQ